MSQSIAGPVLEISNLTIRFGGFVALDRVSFSIPRGALVGIVGPNGAGKTTLFDAISGFRQPDSGDISFGGRPMARLPAYRRARLGITRTFQDVGLFGSLSVADNVRAAVDWQRKRFGGDGSADASVGLCLDGLGLGPFAASPVGTLSFGWRKRVAIARALASQPSLLLLDEPTAGLMPDAAAEAGELIRRAARRDGITVLLIEHNVPFVLEVCERVIVLELGRVLADGQGDAIRNDPAVLRAYLGRSS